MQCFSELFQLLIKFTSKTFPRLIVLKCSTKVASSNIVKKLGLFIKEQSKVSIENSLSGVEIAIAKYRNHPSIIVITEKMEKLGNPTFGFDFTWYEEALKEVNNLKIRKVSQKIRYSCKNYEGKFRYCFLFPVS